MLCHCFKTQIILDLLGEQNAKSESLAAHKSVVNEFPAEFSKTLMNKLFCKLCECVVTCSKKFFMDSHSQTLLSETKRQPVNAWMYCL